MDDCDLHRWVCAWAAQYPADYDDVILPFAGRAALTMAEVDAILVWKFGSTPHWLQQARGALANCEEGYVVDVVARAIRSNDDLGAMLLLQDIKRFGHATASAILMATNPQRYTVYDVRANKSLEALRMLQTDECQGVWLNYLESCRRVSRRADQPLRRVDQALYKANGVVTLPPGPLPACCQ